MRCAVKTSVIIDSHVRIARTPTSSTCGARLKTKALPWGPCGARQQQISKGNLPICFLSIFVCLPDRKVRCTSGPPGAWISRNGGATRGGRPARPSVRPPGQSGASDPSRSAPSVRSVHPVRSVRLLCLSVRFDPSGPVRSIPQIRRTELFGFPQQTLRSLRNTWISKDS